MNPHKAQLDQFLEHINLVVRDSFSSYGKAASVQPLMTTQRETGLNLHRKSIEFAQEFVNPNSAPERLDLLAQEVEGLILAGNSIGVLSEKEVDQLIVELYDIKEKK